MKFPLITFLFFCFQSFNSFAEERKLFATKENDSIQIVYNLDAFRADIIESCFREEKKKPIFVSVEIIERVVIGDTTKKYFSVLMSDSSGTIQIGKWLDRIGDEFYIIDKSNQTNLLKTCYIACSGKEKCTPSVISVSGGLEWTCGHAPPYAGGKACKLTRTWCYF